MIVIRQTKDIHFVTALDLQLFGNDVDPPRAHHLWWLAWDGARIAGYCGLGVFDAEGVPCGFLSRAGVMKDFRGQGLQKRFIRVRESAARARGAKEMLTYTSRTNFPSANNLIACGYKLYEPQSAWGVAGALYFQKRL